MSELSKLFVANWKMHGDLAMSASWAAQFQPPPSCRTVVCPPTPYLSAARAALPITVAVGAQNLCRHGDDGAYTGEVSARMLVDIGCDYVIVGHSERRAMGETDEDCAAKLAAAAHAGLSPIFCIGETAAEYAAGQTDKVLERQLQVLATAAQTAAVFAVTAVAYEPVWAIGSGKTPSASDLQHAQKHIRRQLIAQTAAFGDTIPILYGGSINPDNADMLGAADMDGGLVGGASLDASIFAKICRQSGV